MAAFDGLEKSCQENQLNSIQTFVDGLLNEVVDEAVKSAKNTITNEKTANSNFSMDDLRVALLKSEENNAKLMSKNIASNKNYIQLSQENTMMKSKIFQMSTQITSLEYELNKSKVLMESKNELIDKQGEEIDKWQIKSTEIERMYDNKLKKIEAEQMDKKASVDFEKFVEIENIVSDKLASENDEKIQSHNKNPNEIHNGAKFQNEKDSQNEILNGESPIEDVTQYKAMVNKISKYYLESRSKLVNDYENLFVELKCLKIENPNDDMNMIYAKNAEEKLTKFLEEKILMDKTIIDLQQDKIALEEHIIECKNVWHKEEKKLQDKIDNLENTLRKYSRANNSYCDSKDPLSDSGKIVYLRQLVLQLLLTKDWTIKHGMLTALQKLLDLTDEEVHALRYSL